MRRRATNQKTMRQLQNQQKNWTAIQRTRRSGVVSSRRGRFELPFLERRKGLQQHSKLEKRHHNQHNERNTTMKETPQMPAATHQIRKAASGNSNDRQWGSTRTMECKKPWGSRRQRPSYTRQVRKTASKQSHRKKHPVATNASIVGLIFFGRRPGI